MLFETCGREGVFSNATINSTTVFEVIDGPRSLSMMSCSDWISCLRQRLSIETLKRTIVTLCVVMGLLATQVALAQPSDQPTIVTNKAPLYADISYSYDLVFAIGGEEGDDRLKVPYLILVDEEGSIFVADSNPWQILKYDARGNFVRRFGAPGEGPGEFRMIASMTLTSEGELAVYDARQSRVQYFDLDGTVLRQIRLSTGAIGIPEMFIREGAYYFGGNFVDRKTHRRLPSVRKYDREGTFVEAPFTNDNPPEKTSAHFSFDEQGSFYYIEPLDWFRYHVEKYDQAGTLQLVIERENDPIKLPKEEVERQTEAVRARGVNAPNPFMASIVKGTNASPGRLNNPPTHLTPS